MIRVPILLVCMICAGCFYKQSDVHGQCGSDGDCPTTARCDKSQAPPVCVAFACNPACDAASTCDEATVTCKPVTTASVVVTSPAANGFVGGKVQVAATARAPGGVTGITFQVKDANGTHNITGAGTAPIGSAEFSAALNLPGAGFTDGPASVVAILSYAGGTLTSSAVPVIIDQTPPQVALLEVFLAGAEDPNATGLSVTPPPPLITADGFSGHDGSSFILNDQVHIKGTMIDSGAGLSCATLQYRIDGADASGIVRAPTTQPLPGCTADGSNTVHFDIPSVTLNDITKYGRLGRGIGDLKLVLLAADNTTGTRNVMPESAASSVSIPATRLWWKRRFTVSSGTITMSGLAIHPNGDVIVTVDASVAPAVFALFSDGPFHVGRGEDWSTQGVGTVVGAPAIGLGSATTARTYVASKSLNTISALSANGAPAWSTGSEASFTTSPAIMPNATVKLTTACEAVLAAGTKGLTAACQDRPGSVLAATSSSPLGANTTESPVTVGGSSIFVATDTSIAQTSIDGSSGSGLLTPVKIFVPSTNNPPLFSGPLVTPSAQVFAASVGDPTVYGLTFTGTGTKPFTQDFAKILSAAVKGVPIFASASTVSFVTADGKLHMMTIGGADTVLGSIPDAGSTLLLGHDGLTYVGRSTGITAVGADASVAWDYTPSTPTAMTVPPTVNCNGTLYTAGGDTVYAFVTDMMSDPSNAGLADTPWPKFQRDTRNTGNADVTIRFGVRTAAGANGCTQ